MNRFIHKFVPASLFIFLLLHSICFGQNGKDIPGHALQFSEHATIKDSLNTYLKEIDTSGAEKASRLNIATDFFAFVSRNSIKQYYKLASKNYVSSIKNADFKTERKAITREVNRLLPLLSDRTQKKWKQYRDEENSQLFNEIIGFWEIRDPYPETETNERLVEHWNRISYAQKSFTENDDSPYETDDRGILYVRLGKPDYINTDSFDIPFVNDIRANTFNFIQKSGAQGAGLSGSFEIWNYKHDDRADTFFIFGRKNGVDNYGLQRTILDTFNYKSLKLKGLSDAGNINNLNYSSDSYIRGVAMYALLERLSSYKPQYNALYQRMISSLQASQSSVNSFVFFPTSIGKQDELLTVQQMQEAPAGKSNLLGETNTLKVRHRFYRFLDKQQRPLYIFALASQPDSMYADSTTYFTKNNFYAYDDSWTLQAHDLQNKYLKETATFVLSDAYVDFKLYFSSELLGQTSKAAANLVAATGKQKITLPDPLLETKPFIISDIVLADEQKPDFENELPVTPKLSQVFKENQSVMIYFEAYGVPPEGYSFSYFFKKDRRIFRDKKVDSRSEITVLADRTRQRDSQLFSIQLSDLDSGSYKLVLRFAPLEKAAEKVSFEKELPIKIIE